MSGAVRIRRRDLLFEAVSGVVQRPGRSILTAFGTVLGVAVLIIVIGLTTSAAAQISDRFDPVAATEVTAIPVTATVADAILLMPEDAPRQAGRILGVRTAGIGYPLDGIGGIVARTPLDGGTRLPVFGATAGFLEGVGADMASGARFTSWHDEHRSRVALLGPQAARALGYGGYATGSAIWLDGVRFIVAGVIRDVEARPELLSAVILPASTAREVYPEARAHQYVELRVTTDPGAAATVGDQLALALDPTLQTDFEISKPPDASALQEGVTNDLTSLLVLLGGVCLIIGLVGIANTTFVAVIERTPEIGVRRAIGAQRRHIMAQFLIEATMLGTLGGIVGSAIGVVTVVLVCLTRQWTAVLDWRLAVAGPLLGAVTGILAGLAPAWRAAGVEPISALRS